MDSQLIMDTISSIVSFASYYHDYNRISNTASERIEIYTLYFIVKERFMSKDSNARQRTYQQQTQKIIVERHYVGTDK